MRPLSHLLSRKSISPARVMLAVVACLQLLLLYSATDPSSLDYVKSVLAKVPLNLPVVVSSTHADQPSAHMPLPPQAPDDIEVRTQITRRHLARGTVMFGTLSSPPCRPALGLLLRIVMDPVYLYRPPCKGQQLSCAKNSTSTRSLPSPIRPRHTSPWRCCNGCPCWLSHRTWSE